MASAAIGNLSSIGRGISLNDTVAISLEWVSSSTGEAAQLFQTAQALLALSQTSRGADSVPRVFSRAWRSASMVLALPCNYMSQSKTCFPTLNRARRNWRKGLSPLLRRPVPDREERRAENHDSRARLRPG